MVGCGRVALSSRSDNLPCSESATSTHHHPRFTKVVTNKPRKKKNNNYILRKANHSCHVFPRYQKLRASRVVDSGLSGLWSVALAARVASAQFVI
jgi:hypothetical protein